MFEVKFEMKRALCFLGWVSTVLILVGISIAILSNSTIRGNNLAFGSLVSVFVVVPIAYAVVSYYLVYSTMVRWVKKKDKYVRHLTGIKRE